MAFLSGLFGSKTPQSSLAALRRAVEKSAWADAIAQANDIDAANLSAVDAAEMEQLRTKAADALAQLNLDEARACLNIGDHERAQEHVSLALFHGRDQELLESARNLLAAPTPVRQLTENSCLDKNCCSVAEPRYDSVDDFDTRTRLELLLAAYPDNLRDRYLNLDDRFIEAILLAHEGSSDAAFQILDALPDDVRDDLFWFERGSLLARLGRTHTACQDLDRCLSLNLEHQLAREILIELLVDSGDYPAAQHYLNTPEGHVLPNGFRSARLALIANVHGDMEQSLAFSLSAIEQGCRDENVLLNASRLSEERGLLAEAERILHLLPATGGCSGSGNLPLAEFRLRHRKDLDKALDTFRALARHDQTNPFWALRLGQTYLALQRNKEARPLLEVYLAAGTDEKLLLEARSAYTQISS